jgi:hypothetical protein
VDKECLSDSDDDPDEMMAEGVDEYSGSID